MKILTRMPAFILLLISFSTFAQSDKYLPAMQKGLQLLQTGKSPDEYLTAANHFERIARVENSQWLPAYYSAYCNLLAGLMTESKDKKDQYYDKALSQIMHADSLSGNNSEIYTVRGYIEFMKMAVDPMSRMSFMKSASASLEKAIELNPENPRPYLVRGQNTFYTPAAFGGGKAAAKPLLEKAEAKFDSFKPENAIAPNWGHERNQALLAQCN